MNYESFINGRNKLNELYDVVRKSDGEEVLECEDYNRTYCFVCEDPHLYDIYIN